MAIERTVVVGARRRAPRSMSVASRAGAIVYVGSPLADARGRRSSARSRASSSSASDAAADVPRVVAIEARKPLGLTLEAGRARSRGVHRGRAAPTGASPSRRSTRDGGTSCER